MLYFCNRKPTCNHTGRIGGECTPPQKENERKSSPTELEVTRNITKVSRIRELENVKIYA